jgi:predicted nucleic acid-binding protein
MGIEVLLSNLRSSKTVLLDTNSLIYYFDDIPPYGNALEQVFHYVTTGDIHAYLSAVTSAELFVKPLRERNSEIVNQYLTFFHCFPNLTLADVTQDVAMQAALIRAETGLPMPDALIIATAAIKQCPILGNDSKWVTKKLPVPYYCLADYI